jgi:hypothetical protein
MRNKAIIAFGVVLFLVLAGTGTANALWSSLANLGGTVTSGRIAISQSGFDQLSVEYSASVNQKVAPVTVTNTGSVLLQYSVLMSGSTTNNTIASTASLQARIVGSAAACAATTVSTANTWVRPPSLTGTLNPGASVVYCVQSTMTTDQIKANNGRSMAASVVVNATTAGSWTARADGAATQSARLPLPARPATLASTDTSGYSTTLSWADGAGAGNSAATSYNILRNGVPLVSNVKSPYIDTTAARNTDYTYTVQAVDAAGNISTEAATVNVRTLNITSSSWYTVGSQRASGCIDVGSYWNGSPLEFQRCDFTDAQKWAFVKASDGTYWISSGQSSNSGWFGVNSNNFPVQLTTYSGTKANFWRAVPIGGAGTTSFQFVNEATDRCLDLSNGSTSNGTRLVQSTCRPSTDARTQGFVLNPR